MRFEIYIVPADNLKNKKIPNINLLPEEEFEKTPVGKFIKWALSTGRYIIVFTELIVILAFLSRFKLDRDLTDLHESIEQKRAIVASAVDLEKEIRNLTDNLEKIKQASNFQKSYSSFIVSFSQLVPEEISLENFTLKGDSLILSCTSFTPQGIGYFIYQLKTSPWFKNIAIENISRKGDEPIKFNLKVDLTEKAFEKL